MGLFGGVENAKYSEGGVYVKPGVYRFELMSLKTIKTRQQVNAVVAEFLIHESSNMERPPKSVCSWMLMCNNETWLGNFKQFLAALLQKDESTITEQACEFAVSPAGNEKIKGRMVRCSATDILTKKQTLFTKCKYFHDTDETGAKKAQAEDAAKSAA